MKKIAMKPIDWNKRKIIQLNPPQILALGVLALITIGGLLLKLPFATENGISWINAYFTVTSATTVTGLYVVDTGTTFTLFGDIVIMLLMQTGGIGFMTVAILVILTLGKRIGLKQRILIKEALNQTSFGGIIRLVKRVLLFSAIIEGTAIVLLMFVWAPQFGFWKGLHYSVFHVIAAYNNAGFTLWENNLTQFVGDPVVNIIITLLIIIGGLGFTVLTDLWSSKDFKSLTLHSKLMIVGTIGLLVFGTVAIFLLEVNNLKTIGGLEGMARFWAAFFQSVTARTAGFNTLNYAEMNESTLILTIFLMFIGAGSASAGGGIKVTTFLVLLLSVIGFITGKEYPVVFSRQLKKSSMMKALSIFVVSQTFIFIAVCVLMITEDARFLPVLFEVVSAFGTVGLSMGLTLKLSFIGKLVIMFMMYCGLLGPLTIFFSLSQSRTLKFRYPSEDIMTG